MCSIQGLKYIVPRFDTDAVRTSLYCCIVELSSPLLCSYEKILLHTLVNNTNYRQVSYLQSLPMLVVTLFLRSLAGPVGLPSNPLRLPLTAFDAISSAPVWPIERACVVVSLVPAFARSAPPPNKRFKRDARTAVFGFCSVVFVVCLRVIHGLH